MNGGYYLLREVGVEESPLVNITFVIKSTQTSMVN